MSNTILAGNGSGRDCYNYYSDSGQVQSQRYNLIGNGYGCLLNTTPEDLIGSNEHPIDPLLGPLQDNGGPTFTHALGPGSPAIDAGEPDLLGRGEFFCPIIDQRGVTRPQRDRCDIGAYEVEAPILIDIGGMPHDTYLFALEQTQRLSYPGVNSGPVYLSTFDGTPLVASQRVIYKVNGVPTSYSEIMAMPWAQLDTTYWLPWYNNVDLDSQLRMTNVSGFPTTVQVTIGGVPVPGGVFTLEPSQSIRRSFPGVDNGPLKITSQQPLVVSERVIYRVGGVPTSFNEMMGLPESHLDTVYWLPWYNNADLDTQLRIANVTDQPATVTVTIGGVTRSSFSLAAGGSRRVSYPALSAGPVQIVSTGHIVAAARVIYRVNGVETSFSEMMALPQNRLTFTYWLPWYNNVDLDTQLRVANTGPAPAAVHVTLRGAELPGSPFTLEPGQSTRRSFPGVSDGPLHIFSDAALVVSARLIYRVNGVATSYSETMPLSGDPLKISHVLPWYNNVELDTQLRVGVPQ